MPSPQGTGAIRPADPAGAARANARFYDSSRIHQRETIMQNTPSFAAALGAATLALTLGQPAAAVEQADFRFDNTRELAAVCAVAADAAEYAIANQACRAFIEATVQYHDQVSDRKKMKRLVCYPANATIEDGKAAFVTWAAANAGNAKLMAEQPVVGLVRALAAKYPCKG